MAGPYPPHQGFGAAGPPYSDPHPSRPFPSQPAYAGRYPAQRYPGQLPPGPPYGEPPPGVAAYPGMLPPAVPYPRRSRWRVLLWTLLAIALTAAMVAAIVYGVRDDKPASGGPLTAPAAKTAIQGYLNALSKGDTETIARNTLCGIYDAVRDRRSDQALAKLSSDAFRKQFSRAEVTSIDKMVYWSSTQTQVLFSMRVTPTAGGGPKEEQGIAQLLAQDNQVLVCSYLLRTAAFF